MMCVCVHAHVCRGGVDIPCVFKLFVLHCDVGVVWYVVHDEL
jgi:hypothetical protein